MVMGEVVARAVGMPLRAWAQKVLFEPLGIEEWTWWHYPDGTAQAGGGLSLRARDVLKLGILALRGGSWEGRQIVPEGWMVRSTQPQVPWSEGDAGYFGEQGATRRRLRLV